MKLFDRETGYLRLDEIVAERESFRRVMEDGIVTDDELREQAALVIGCFQKLEEQLSEEQEELVTEAISELAVLFEMNAQKEEQEG